MEDDEAPFNPMLAAGGGNPLFGANPFAMANPFTNARPREESDDGFNVDDLVKRIDAKIAELEEEERREKEKEAGNVKEAIVTEKEPSEIVPPELTIIDDDANKTIPEPKKEPVPEPAVINKNVNDDTKNLYSDDTDEDNFFDDFFADE